MNAIFCLIKISRKMSCKKDAVRLFCTSALQSKENLKCAILRAHEHSLVVENAFWLA